MLIAFLYRLAQAAAFPFLLLYLARRILRNRAYARNLGERFGRVPVDIRTTPAGGIWLHAVSVGEVLSAVTLLKRVRATLPGVPLFVSTTTLAGRELAHSKLAGLADAVFYAPVDYVFAVRATLRRLRPALVIVMETEIWPNLYRESKRCGARLLVVNGRISDAAFPKYLRWRWFFSDALRYADEILAQGPTAARRYRDLGAGAVESGNLKYDFDPASVSVAPDLFAALPNATIAIAASTMPPAGPGDIDEDDLIIDAFRQLAPTHPDLLLILVPRRPERFDEAARKLERLAVPYARRSQLPPALETPSVLLLDSIGELAGLFSLAHAVVMCGSFARRGGHNILEPAAFGVPIIHGANMQNFSEIADEFEQGKASIKLANPAGLAATLADVLLDAKQIGARAKNLSDKRRGATAHALARIGFHHSHGLYRPPAPLLWHVWHAGLKLHRALTRTRRLATPVVSIGNLAFGGTGKTPMVIWLVQQLQRRGYKPVILTRGYRSAEEAQLLGNYAPVGVNPNRYKAAQSFPDASVFVLDDGFQHWRLARDFDLVLIDALDPFRGFQLREPFAALRRASAVVLTRASNPLPALEAEIRRHTQAPLFYAATVATPPLLPSGRIGAFCGIGHPASFRKTLEELGIEPIFFEVFPDHYRYSAADMDALQARCDVLVTTEKDQLNCPRPVHAIRIQFEIENAADLLDLITEHLPPARAST